MVQFLRKDFPAGGEGEVGDIEAFISPMLEGCGVEIGVFGRDDHARLLLRGVVPAELHLF